MSTKTPWKILVGPEPSPHSARETWVCLSVDGGGAMDLTFPPGNTKEECKTITDKILLSVNTHAQLVEALEAIKARVCGDWENPALAKFGEPSNDDLLDVCKIAEAALTAAKSGK